MTSGKGLTPHRSWAFHPLEFGVCGDDRRQAALLARRLASGLGSESAYVDAEEASDPEQWAWDSLDRDFLIVSNVPPGLMVPRLQVLSSSRRRSSQAVDHRPGPVVVCGPSPRPRRLAWGVPWFDQDDLSSLSDFVQGYWDSQLASRPLLGLVLAGGRGGLLGYDKAELTFGGRNQVERAFHLLSPFCAQTWVSCRKEQATATGRLGWPQIHDRYLDRGPLGGILSAFDHRPDSAWLVIACDHPYLDEATVGDLLARRDPRGFATSFRGSDGLPQPLCTVYEPKARQGLLRSWALGYSCPRKLLVGRGSRLLDPLFPSRLDDVNTPRQNEEAKRVLGP